MARNVLSKPVENEPMPVHFQERAGAESTLLERELEVFVVRRDKKTGELISLTACCEDALADPCCDDAVVQV